jgi:glycosyltransferase involved in cell wall biosynthesis
MTRPRAVLVAPVMPVEQGNGLAMRAGLLLEGLARRWSVDVVLAPVFGAPAGPTGLVRRLAASCRVLQLSAPADARADMVLRLGDPRQRERATSLHPRPALGASITLAAARELAGLAAGAELVVVARLYLAPLLDLLLESARRPAVALDVDDLESDARRELGEEQEAERFARLEGHYLPLLDRALACSAADANELAARHRLGEVAVVPNAVRLPASIDAAPRRFELLFVGNLGYRPNIEAAGWLCREVRPRLGDVRVAIAGSSPAAEVAALASDGRVTVAADLPDLTPWYAATAIAVVPVKTGGGTRIKLLEALAHRRPVVSTERGIAGIEWARGRAALVADEPESFAEACRRLLADPGLSARMGEAGRRLVERHANVETVATEIERLAVDIVSSARAARL